MSSGVTIQIHRRIRFVLSAVTLLISLTCYLHPYSSNAQMPEKVRSLGAQFFQEGGCPVAITQTRAELDLDAFDAPLDARIYLTYRNISDRPIGAAKFRIRFSDVNGKDLGTVHAPDDALIGPGQERTQKFKRDRIHPATTTMQIRVLQVKYADGSMWNSTKMQELASPGGPLMGAPGADPNMPQPGGDTAAPPATPDSVPAGP